MHSEQPPTHDRFMTLYMRKTVTDERLVVFRSLGCGNETCTYWRLASTLTPVTGASASCTRRTASNGTWRWRSCRRETPAYTSVRWTPSRRSTWPCSWTSKVVRINRSIILLYVYTVTILYCYNMIMIMRLCATTVTIKIIIYYVRLGGTTTFIVSVCKKSGVTKSRHFSGHLDIFFVFIKA